MAAEIVSRLQLLIRTGLLLANERGPDGIVQTALTAGQSLCQATWGAFFELPRPQRDPVGLPLATPISASSLFTGPPTPSLPGNPSLTESDVLRSDDIQIDPRYDWHVNATVKSPEDEVLPAATRVRSYLAVPVRQADGEAIGALLYGHGERGAFPAEVEPLLLALAAQTAAALANARFISSLQQQADLADAARAGQRAASLRLVHALDAAQMGTWSWSAATGLIDFDQRAAELFGVEPHVPFSRDNLRQHLVHREDLAFSADDLRDLAHAGLPYNTEYRLAMPDGAPRWVGVRGNPTLIGEGVAEGMIGTVQDITPRKSQEEALRTSEKLAATGRLAATIAHEINNPLEAVTNLIYLARTDPEAPAAVRRMLDIADAELGRVSQIAQHTLGFYRDTTSPGPVDLNALLGATVELFERKLHGKGLHCTLDLEPGLSVVGLQGEIRQVVSNLLVNAIDASSADGGQIRIRGRHRHRAEGKGVAVLICDQGTGIPHHVKPRLFTPFVTTKVSTGTGLGLWVTRGMVEKHGGSICFRSRTAAPSGTVFRVYLPHSGVSALFASPTAAAIQ